LAYSVDIGTSLSTQPATAFNPDGNTELRLYKCALLLEKLMQIAHYIASLMYAFNALLRNETEMLNTIVDKIKNKKNSPVELLSKETYFQTAN
jgi:hypothetical protein